MKLERMEPVEVANARWAEKKGIKPKLADDSFAGDE